MLVYEENLINNRVSPLQKERLLRQGDFNRKVIKPSSLRIATLQDLKVGLPLFHYTNCGHLWCHILRSRNEEPPYKKGETDYIEYKNYIKQGVEQGLYYIIDESKPKQSSRTVVSNRRTSKSPM
jgi:hypothetical protein